MTGFSKNSGRPGGGETITITGTNFDNNVSVVLFGDVSASFNVLDASTIQATTPQHVVGSFYVYVTNVDGQSQPGPTFTFKTIGGFNHPLLGM